MELWIRRLRKRKGWTQAELAERMGTSQQNVQRLETGKISIDLEWIRKLGRAFDMHPKDMLGDAVDPVELTTIPVIGAVEAGTWREAMEWAPSDRYDLAVNHDPDHPGVRRFGLIVRGPSMNRVMPEGTVLICAKLLDLGENPVPGDYVICRRLQPSGLVEATVKQYEVDRDGRHWLWPRSDHPAHQAPIPLPAAAEGSFADEDVIVDAVVLDYTVKARKRRPESLMAKAEPRMHARSSKRAAD